MFAAWPANNGIWSWDGQEILVGFTVGAFEERAGHNIIEPYRSLLARSTDQGDTWSSVEPAHFVGTEADPRAVIDAMDFADPGFTMRVVGIGYHGSKRPEGAFFASSDRGGAWQGPFTFGCLAECLELEGLDITARTDYVIEGPSQCLVFMSTRGGSLASDTVFCVRTVDGGRSFRFVSWIVPPSDPYRAVMPSTVRLPSGALVTAVRRREPNTQRCWIDAYGSADTGQSWRLLGKVADTGGWNGNPPALAVTPDGRLCCVFGNRDACRMVARYSADGGGSWGDDLLLRDDFNRDRFQDPDLGYARLLRRADGKMIACYYWATAESPHQHVAATIWDADED